MNATPRAGAGSRGLHQICALILLLPFAASACPYPDEGTMPLRRTVPAEDTSAPASSNAPLHFALQHIDRHHSCLARRGLAAATIRTFGVGFYSGSGFLAAASSFPSTTSMVR